MSDCEIKKLSDFKTFDSVSCFNLIFFDGVKYLMTYFLTSDSILETFMILKVRFIETE